MGAVNDIFRDPTEGALARRRELVRERRDDLALMPHAIRRVVVARRARTWASVAVIATGTIALVAAASPSLASLIARGMPGLVPAALSTCLIASWLAGILVYVAARAMQEHRFAVAMSRCVLPGEDLDHDLERLSHERPDEVARNMAHRLEVASAALPVAAASFLLPASALYLGLAARAKGWPATTDFEQALAGHAHALLAIAAAGLVGAMFMTRRAMRLPNVAPLAAMVAVVAAPIAAFAPGALRWIALATCAIAGATAIVVRRLRIERARIETEDPAAGSEFFTWHGFVAGMRQTMTRARELTRSRHVRLSLLTLGVLGGAAYAAMPKHAAIARPETPRIETPHLIPGELPVSKFHTTRLADGRLQIDIEFVDSHAVDIPALAGLLSVPSGWRADVTIVAATADPVLVTPFGDESTKQLADQDSATFSVCADHERPISLHVATLNGGPQAVRLVVDAKLALASCTK
jgi:hypothetical protein